MEAKVTVKQNPIRRLLEYKRAMRDCIQRGADHEEMKQITKDYGFTLATPVCRKAPWGRLETCCHRLDNQREGF